MTYQTTVQNSKTIRFGSAKIEVGETVGSLVDLGIASDVEIKEEFEEIKLEPDNAAPIVLGINTQSVTTAFDLWETNLTNLNLIRGGIDTLGSVAGDPVSVTTEAHTLTGTSFVRLNNKNGAGTEVGSIVVTDSVSGACVRNTDYIIAIDPAGYTCIARVSGSSVISDGEAVNVAYSYTPYASATLSSGGKTTISPRVVRLTNLNALGKKFEITVYKATPTGGIELKLPGDDSADPLKTSIELQAYCDTTRTAGDQLYKIVDEQGV